MDHWNNVEIEKDGKTYAGKCQVNGGIMPSGCVRCGAAEVRSHRAACHFCCCAVDEVRNKGLQMHLGRSAGCRIRKTKERHRYLVCGEPDRCAKTRAGRVGVPMFRICTINGTHRRTKQIVHQRGSKSKLFLGQASAEDVTSDSLGGKFVRILLLAALLPVAGVMSTTS